jgi:hypothetical protein
MKPTRKPTEFSFASWKWGRLSNRSWELRNMGWLSEEQWAMEHSRSRDVGYSGSRIGHRGNTWTLSYQHSAQQWERR